MFERILQLLKGNWLPAIRIDIRRSAGQHVYAKRLCKRNGKNIVGFENGHAGRINDRVSAHLSRRFLIVLIVIPNQIGKRQGAVQVAAPAETFLLRHRASRDASAGRVGIGEVQDGNASIPDQSPGAVKGRVLHDGQRAVCTLV